jgi:drug/metabolite transporter (DMT)-like permease
VVTLGAGAIYVPFNLSRRDLVVFGLLGIANQAVLAAVFLNDQMSWRKALGLALGVGGVAFVVEGRVASGIEDPVGIAFTVAALVSLVGGTILFKKLKPTGGLWVGNGVQSLVAGLVTLPLALAFESAGDIVPTWQLMASLIYLALFVSIFAYLLWFHLLNVSGATAASSYHFLMPPLGMLLGWVLLGEHVALADLWALVRLLSASTS